MVRPSYPPPLRFRPGSFAPSRRDRFPEGHPNGRRGIGRATADPETPARLRGPGRPTTRQAPARTRFDLPRGDIVGGDIVDASSAALPDRREPGPIRRRSRTDRSPTGRSSPFAGGAGAVAGGRSSGPAEPRDEFGGVGDLVHPPGGVPEPVAGHRQGCEPRGPGVSILLVLARASVGRSGASLPRPGNRSSEPGSGPIGRTTGAEGGGDPVRAPGRRAARSGEFSGNFQGSRRFPGILRAGASDDRAAAGSSDREDDRNGDRNGDRNDDSDRQSERRSGLRPRSPPGSRSGAAAGTPPERTTSGAGRATTMEFREDSEPPALRRPIAGAARGPTSGRPPSAFAPSPRPSGLRERGGGPVRPTFALPVRTCRPNLLPDPPPRPVSARPPGRARSGRSRGPDDDGLPEPPGSPPPALTPS